MCCTQKRATTSLVSDYARLTADIPSMLDRYLRGESLGRCGAQTAVGGADGGLLLSLQV